MSLNESIVSLLIKLHNKLSDKESSYQLPAVGAGMASDSNLVGDGTFFVGRVLDTLSAKSSKCTEAIRTVLNDMKPKSTGEGNSSSAK